MFVSDITLKYVHGIRYCRSIGTMGDVVETVVQVLILRTQNFWILKLSWIDQGLLLKLFQGGFKVSAGTVE